MKYSSISSLETTPHTPSGGRKFRHLVKVLDMIERPFGLSNLSTEEYVENCLDKMTEAGEQVVAIMPDGPEDFLVVLMVPVAEGPGS